MRLGVNIDHIATLRQARGAAHPDPVEAAHICKQVGAHAVVMHLREDRRHIQDRDLFHVKKKVPIRLNLEMSIAPSIARLAEKLKPDQVTLVPEKRQERTTEGGLNLMRKTQEIRRCVEKLKSRGTQVSLFIDPEFRQIEMAKRLGVDAVEFHTGDYANAFGVGRLPPGRQARTELERLKKAAGRAARERLHVYAGHGLDYQNVRPVAKIPAIEELNIGYAIVTRALWVGFENAVREMLGLLTSIE